MKIQGRKIKATRAELRELVEKGEVRFRFAVPAWADKGPSLPTRGMASRPRAFFLGTSPNEAWPALWPHNGGEACPLKLGQTFGVPSGLCTVVTVQTLHYEPRDVVEVVYRYSDGRLSMPTVWPQFAHGPGERFYPKRPRFSATVAHISVERVPGGAEWVIGLNPCTLNEQG